MQKQSLVFEEDVKHSKPETYTQTHMQQTHTDLKPFDLMCELCG